MVKEQSRMPARGTRPRNRRALILDAAADLFVRVGYPRVAMSDIAEAVAIAPSALYRHFGGKEDLLLQAVRAQFDAFSADLEVGANESIDDLLVRLAGSVIERRGLGMLWQRESRHLPPEQRSELRDLLVGVERALSARLHAGRPDLSGRQPDLLAWATMGALMSVAFQRVRLPHAEYVALLADIGHDIVAAPLPPASDDDDPPDNPSGSPTGHDPGWTDHATKTADRLVATATRLFAERGFRTVGIDEVAADVGIAGPSVYHHFTGKAELLYAAMGDGARILLSEQTAITGGQDPPEQLLADLVHSYVDFTFGHRHLVDLMITETASLSPTQSRQGLDQQRRYVAEWVRLVGLVHPDLPAGHARVRVQAVLTMTNDISRTADLNAQPAAREAVTAVCAAILGLPGIAVPASPNDARNTARAVRSPSGVEAVIQSELSARLP